MTAKLSIWWALFTQQLAADKKKSAVLGVLALVLLIVLGRVMLSGPGPAPADAAPAIPVAPTPPSDPVKPSVRPALETATAPPVAGPAVAGAQTAPAQVSSASPPRKGSAARSVRVEDLPRILERDVFYSRAWAKAVALRAAEAGDGEDGAADKGPADRFWERLSGALGQIPEQRRGDLARLDGELAKLTLQSTMTGPIPMAYVSGRLVHPGDTIDGFSVVRIKDRRVTVRKYGFSRELKMP